MDSDNLETARKVYFDAVQTIRHYDKERTATHRFALAVLSALLAVGGSDIFSSDGMSLSVALFGAFTALLFLAFSSKYAALIERERGRARAARDVLAELGDDTISIIDGKKQEMASKAVLSRWRLSSLWTVYYLGALVGFFILLVQQLAG